MSDTPLDDLIGQKVRHDGHEWTVRYSEATKRIALERPLDVGLEPILQAMRDGAVVLTNDPVAIAGQPPPPNREAATQEWMILDAMITGARRHSSLATVGIQLLERRLADLTECLKESDFEVRESGERVRPADLIEDVPERKGKR